MEQIELYDIGRTTHRPVKGMYEFAAQHADGYVKDRMLAEAVKRHATGRELNGSIPQDIFNEICRIAVEGHKGGKLSINFGELPYPDTIPRFQKVKAQGRKIGVLSSASVDFTKLMYGTPLSGRKLSDIVDVFFLGEDVGDKDNPETHANLWRKTNGGVYALFDDKLSVCKAALEGFRAVGADPKIYLVNREGKQSPELEELASRGINVIRTFDEVKD